MKGSNDYRSDLYEQYYQTQIVPREGTPTLAQFKAREALYRRQFLPLLPDDKNAHILDLGCGSGSLVWFLQRNGFEHASGIDLSRDLIAAGSSLGVRNLRHGNFHDQVQGVDVFDAIVMRDVLEHVPKPEIPELLRRCRDYLRPGGVLIIQVPNAAAPFASKLRYEDFTHELSFTVASLKQVLLLSGFSRVRFLPSDALVSGLRSRLRSIALMILTPLTRVFMKIMIGGDISILTPSLIAVAAKDDGRQCQ